MFGLKKLANASFIRYKTASGETPYGIPLKALKATGSSKGPLALPKKLLGAALSQPVFAASTMASSAISRLKNRPNMYAGVGS